MKATLLGPVTILITLVLIVCNGQPAAGAEEEGVALAIVYDTSGSMQQPVRDAKGNRTPKFIIARRALEAIMKQLQTFATNATTGAPRRIEAGLFVFNGNGAKELVKFGPFD